MNAAELDQQITIQKKSVSQDPAYGTEVIAWVPLVEASPGVAEKFWAEVRDALPSRAESVTQGLAVARNQTRIRFRYRGDVDSSMRVIIHDGTDVVMQIVGGPAEVGGRKELTEIVCEKYSS